MGLRRWLQNRRIRANIVKFYALIQQEDIFSALEFYRTEIMQHTDELSKCVRVTFHFYQWMLSKDEKDFKTIEQLGSSEPSDSQVMRAFNIVKQLKRVHDINKSLNTPDPGMIPSFSAQKNLLPLEQLALVTIVIQLKSKAEDRNNFDDPFLFQFLDRFDIHSILKEQNTGLDNEISSRLQEVLALEKAKAALDEADLNKAQKVVHELESHPNQTFFHALIDWIGSEALQQKKWEFASGWFTYFLQSGQYFSDNLFFKTGKLVALLGANKFRLARDENDELMSRLKELPESDKSQSLNKIKGFLSYLQALSFFAETKDWETVQEGEKGDSSYEKEIRQQNRTMWKEQKTKLYQHLSKIIEAEDERKWNGYLLNGMAFYVERSAVISKMDLDQYTAAIDQVKNEAVRKRLNYIRGVLLTRINATDEAVMLVENGAYDELKQFNIQILKPLGDGIPALVRAAVYLSIWKGDNAYDPLPELKKIIPDPSEDALINDVIRQVELNNIVRLLISECKKNVPVSEPLPSLSLLSFDQKTEALGKMAATLINLKKEQYQDAFATVSSIHSALETPLRESLDYLKFYAAWKTIQVPVCLEISEKGNHYISQHNEYLKPSLEILLIVFHLSQSKENKGLLSSVHLKLKDGSKEEQAKRTISLLVWMIRQNFEKEALRLITFLLQSEDHTLKVVKEITEPELKFLLAFLNAKTGNYTTAINFFEVFIAEQLSGNSALADASFRKYLRGWAVFFKMQAEIILICRGKEADAKLRWPTLQRSLIEQVDRLNENAELSAYRHLFKGMITAISTDQPANKTIIDELDTASRALLRNSAGKAFTENLLAKLRWKLRVMEEFWTAFQQLRFKESWIIYESQIQPSFGQRIPDPLQFAIIVVQLNLNIISLDEAISRMALLEKESVIIDKSIFDKFWKSVDEVHVIQQLRNLLVEQKYDEYIELTEHTRWEGMKPGTMPVVVAIGLLLALIKTKDIPKALEYGKIFRNTKEFLEWIGNYGRLLYGYALLDDKNYEDGAAVFEEITLSELNGHNTDRYWAVAHFSRGIQLLEVEKQEEAFSSFAKSVTERGRHQNNAKLAPLFLHLGVKYIVETRSGSKATKAFEMLQETVRNDKTEPENAEIFNLLAELGIHLCRALIPNPDRKPSPEHLLGMIAKLPKEKTPFLTEMERAFRILAICLKLREPEPNTSLKAITKFLEKELDILEGIAELLKKNDPLVYVLKALVQLELNKVSDWSKPIEVIRMAKRLGASSEKLDKLLVRYEKLIEQMANSSEAVIDLLDLYLVSHTVDHQIKRSLTYDGHVRAYYQLNRNYTPMEIVQSDGMMDEVQVLQIRLENLHKRLSDKPLSDLASLKPQREELKSLLQKITDFKKEVDTTETKILKFLGERIKNDRSISNELLESLVNKPIVDEKLITHDASSRKFERKHKSSRTEAKSSSGNSTNNPYGSTLVHHLLEPIRKERITLLIEARKSREGKLSPKITPQLIANAIKDKTGETIPVNKISLPMQIENHGSYFATMLNEEGFEVMLDIEIIPV